MTTLHIFRKITLLFSFIAAAAAVSGQNDIIQIHAGDEIVTSKASDILTITFDSVQMPRPLMGLQRWDMYSGEGATYRQELGYLEGAQAFLKPEQWWHRAPFFTRLTTRVPFVVVKANFLPFIFSSEKLKGELP